MKAIRSLFGIKGEFGRGVFTLTMGTVIAQGIGVLSMPILTRLYGAQEFGHFQVFFLVLTLVTAVTTFRYELAVPLPEDRQAALSLVALAMGLAGIVSLLTLAVAKGGLRWGLMPAALH